MDEFDFILTKELAPLLAEDIPFKVKIDFEPWPNKVIFSSCKILKLNEKEPHIFLTEAKSELKSGSYNVLWGKTLTDFINHLLTSLVDMDLNDSLFLKKASTNWPIDPQKILSLTTVYKRYILTEKTLK